MKGEEIMIKCNSKLNSKTSITWSDQVIFWLKIIKLRLLDDKTRQMLIRIL